MTELMAMKPSIHHIPTLLDYQIILQQMREFTDLRTENTPDLFWLLEHAPVFTQGQAGKPEHVLNPGTIPVIKSDRGGQVTYHGPGQLMIYSLVDLKRLKMGIKQFTEKLQCCVIQLLKHYQITSICQPGTPGIFVNDAKIASIGLRVRHGRTYHGMSLNVKMDLSPFTRINPCGFSNLKMTQISEFQPLISIKQVVDDLLPLLENAL